MGETMTWDWILLGVLGVVAYAFLIPSMYCLKLLIDQAVGSEYQDDWGNAIIWPAIVLFVLVMAAFVIICAPFVCFDGGRKGLDRFMGKGKP
jgi:hypothetical protein